MPTALVVEDSQTDRGLMVEYLRQLGLSVTAVTNGDEARKSIAASGHPDLIVLDVILPGQSGFEICREFKANDATKKIPVIISSTKNTDVDKTWGTMLGADGYLTKPVDPDELKKLVRQLMG